MQCDADCDMTLLARDEFDARRMFQRGPPCARVLRPCQVGMLVAMFFSSQRGRTSCDVARHKRRDTNCVAALPAIGRIAARRAARIALWLAVWPCVAFLPKAEGMAIDAIVTGVVAYQWIPPKTCRNSPYLRLQFQNVEPHCHSLFGRAEKGNEHFYKE